MNKDVILPPPGWSNIRDDRLEQLITAVGILIGENARLSGRVEIQMRLLARIVAKMDPALLEDERDPDRRRRSDLLGNTIIDRLKVEALAQAHDDPLRRAELQRYFKDLTP